MEGNFDNRERPTYHDKFHKLVTLFIMTAGSAKAAQFPIMFIVYGGAPFLVAYLIFLTAIAMPIMLLESSLGQFAGDGNRGIFSTVPMYTGIGYTMTLYVTLHMIGDSITLSDCILYIVRTFYGYPLPECAPDWGPYNRSCRAARPETALCRMMRSRLARVSQDRFYDRGFALSSGDDVVLVPARLYVPGATRLFNNWVETSFTTIEALPLLSIAAVWTLVFVIGHRGVTKARFFLYGMTFLYVLTTAMLLLRGVAMSGAVDGLSLLLHADWSYIVNTEMWSNALYISLESVGVTGSMYLGVVKFNSFRNKFQEDVKFVLVADTASIGLGIAITLMSLGSLASTTNIDIAMLVHVDSDFIVSITPQAVGIISYTAFWSRVHSVWLMSTILPKFVLLPDIVLELLSASHPPLLENRTMVYFFICMSLVMLSVLFCCPGGLNIASAVFHQHDQRIRFIILLLESIVVLQYYGLSRLLIDSRIMTGKSPNFIRRLAWATLVPLTAITLLIARLALDPWAAYSNYPTWTKALFAWIDLVELSFIPVFAVVISNHTSNFNQAVAPLPTWEPDRWEEAMLYRQMLVAQGLDKRGRLASSSQRQHSKKSSTAGEQPSLGTTSDALGAQMVIPDGTRPTPATSMRVHDIDDTSQRSSRPVILAPDPSVVQASAAPPILQQPLPEHVATTSQAPEQPPVPAQGASTSGVPSPQVMTPDAASQWASTAGDAGPPPAAIPPLITMAVLPLSSPPLKEAANEPVPRQLAELSPPAGSETASMDRAPGDGVGGSLLAGAQSPPVDVISPPASVQTPPTDVQSPSSGVQSPLLPTGDAAKDKRRKPKKQKRLKKQGRRMAEGTPLLDSGSSPPAPDRPE